MTEILPERTRPSMSEGAQGLMMVFTGNGKGKTTAALGQALRALGQGWTVCIIQFMKGRKYGEVLCAERCLHHLTVHQYGRDRFVRKGLPSKADLELARNGLDYAGHCLSSNEYDLVILDEINVAVDFGLLPLDDVLEILRNRAPGVTVILTGRYAPAAFIDMADTVSEIQDVKHHYRAGIGETAGIEY